MFMVKQQDCDKAFNILIILIMIIALLSSGLLLFFSIRNIDNNKSDSTEKNIIEKIVEHKKTKKKNISESDLKNALQSVAFASRKEAVGDYHSFMALLVSVFAVFGVAWPVVISLLQQNNNKQLIKDNKELIKKNKEFMAKAEEAELRINNLNCLMTNLNHSMTNDLIKKNKDMSIVYSCIKNGQNDRKLDIIYYSFELLFLFEELKLWQSNILSDEEKHSGTDDCLERIRNCLRDVHELGKDLPKLKGHEQLLKIWDDYEYIVDTKEFSENHKRKFEDICRIIKECIQLIKNANSSN